MTQIFLYILVAGSAGTNGTYHYSRVAQPSMAVCLEAVKAAKVQNSGGHENETAVAMFCGGKSEVSSGSSWFLETLKGPGR
jgi:hypothetical protein